MGFIFKHQSIVLDTFSSLRSEVYDSCHGFHYKSSEAFGCAFHKAQSSFFFGVLEGLSKDSCDAFFETIKDSLAAFFKSLDHILRLLHFFLLPMLLKLLIKGQSSKPSRYGTSNLRNRVERTSNRMSQQRPSSFHNSQSKLRRTIDKPFRRFFLKILHTCRNIPEETQRIANDVQTSKNLIKLFDACLLIMRDQLPGDAVYSIDTVINFYTSHLNGCTVDVAHHYSYSRQDGGQEKVVLEVQLFDVQLGGQIDDEWRDFYGTDVDAVLLRWKYDLLPFLCTFVDEIRCLLEVYDLPELVGYQGGEIDEISGKSCYYIVEIDTDLIYERILDKLFAEGDGEVEYRFRILFSCEFLELVRSEDDRTGDDVRIRLVDLQKSKPQLILLLPICFILDKQQPLQGQNHGFEGYLDGL